jgi:hypothetical protein
VPQQPEVHNNASLFPLHRYVQRSAETMPVLRHLLAVPQRSAAPLDERRLTHAVGQRSACIPKPLGEPVPLHRPICPSSSRERGARKTLMHMILLTSARSLLASMQRATPRAAVTRRRGWRCPHSIRPSPRIKPYHPRQAKSSASCLSCDLSPAARLWAVNVHAGVQRCLHRTTLAPANVAGHLVSLRAWPWRKLARPSEARRITARWFCWEGPADDGHGECGCCSHVCAPMGRDVSADPGARPAQPPSRTGRGE